MVLLIIHIRMMASQMLPKDEDGDYAGVVIWQRWDADAVYMYKGQTIDQTLIYNSLDTFVYSR